MSRRYNYVFLYISIVVVVLGTYWQSLLLNFIQDDWGALYYFNKHDTLTVLQKLLGYDNKLFYRPLAQLYLFVMYKLFGANPIPFHIVAFLLHTINAFIIALILRIITRDALISYWVAILYAAAIAIHLDPLAWAVGIYDIGGAFFFFLSLYFFLKKNVYTSVILYFLGCLVKEALIILPVLFLVYLLIQNLRLKRTHKNKKILISIKQIIPFVPVFLIILMIKLSSGISPLSLPAAHPYVIDLFGIHILKNFLTYTVWMYQSLISILPIKISSQAFFILATGFVLFHSLLIVLVFFRCQHHSFQNRRILFLLAWLVISLLPVIFMPNHTYRYYATYALPAFLASLFLSLKYLSLSFHIKQHTVTISLIAITSFAVITSMFQGNQVYREQINQTTLSDGSNYLIRRAAFVNIVHTGLKKDLPSIPNNAVIVIGGADLWAFSKNRGPQFWYDNDTIRVYALSDLKYKDKRAYISNAIEKQGELYTEAKKEFYIDPDKLFIYHVNDGKLVRQM